MQNRWKSPGCSKLLPLIEATELFETFLRRSNFLWPSPDLCIDTVQSLSSAGSSFDLLAGFLLICIVSYETLYWQECVCPNHVHSTEFTRGGLHSRCRKISEMIKRKWRHLSFISSVILRVWILIPIWYSNFYFLISLQKNSKILFLLSHYEWWVQIDEGKNEFDDFFVIYKYLG